MRDQEGPGSWVAQPKTAGPRLPGPPDREETFMRTTKVVLRLPPDLTDQPMTINLIMEYDLMVNILRGYITPKEEGMLVLELIATLRRATLS